MQRHTLKCDPVPFQALVDGVKTFEFRKDDRGYKVDDVLVLQETALPRREVQEGVAMQLTGRSIDRRITYVLRSLNSDYEVPAGYCIMAVVPMVEPPTNAEANVLGTQVGGDHYKKLGQYQPHQVFHAWMNEDEYQGYCVGTAAAYLARNKHNLREDIEKAMHTLQIYLELTDPGRKGSE